MPTSKAAITTNFRTTDGLAVYDIVPMASELWVVAGPAGVDPKTIDTNDLPKGFRWVTDDEWAEIMNGAAAHVRTLAQAVEDWFKNSPSWPFALTPEILEREATDYMRDGSQWSRDDVLAEMTRFAERTATTARR